jgi:hypothetical protein
MFRPQFSHHQALNEHSQVIKRWIQYGSVFVDRFLSSEYIKGLYYKITVMIKRYQEYSQSYKYDTNVINNMIKKYKKCIQH